MSKTLIPVEIYTPTTKELNSNFVVGFGCCGLTDQFHVFMFGYELHKKTGINVFFDISEITSKSIHGGFSLNAFDIFTLPDFNFKIICLESASINSYKENRNYYSYNESGYNNILDIFSTIPPAYITWRSDLFSSNKNILQHITTLNIPLNDKNKEMLFKIKNGGDSVCFHIRRNDLGNELKRFHLKKEYYDNAIKTMLQKLKEPEFFIFCNEMKWVKKNLNFYGAKVNFVEINRDEQPYYELELMRNCKHFIITSGGFGVFAYNLCKNPNKIIIRPTEQDKKYKPIMIDGDEYFLDLESKIIYFSNKPEPMTIETFKKKLQNKERLKREKKTTYKLLFLPLLSVVENCDVKENYNIDHYLSEL